MESVRKAAEMTQQALAKYIQCSILKPFFTPEQVAEYIKEAVYYHYDSVCINPSFIKIAEKLCINSDIKICVVCDFPFGLSTPDSRVELAYTISTYGNIDSVDIVSRYSLIKDGNYKEFRHDLSSLTEIIHNTGKEVNIILETDALTEEEAMTAMSIAIDIGGDAIKTSSGFFTPSREGASFRLISKMVKESGYAERIIPTGQILRQEHFFRLIDLGVRLVGIGYLSAPVVLGLPHTSSVSFFFDEILR